MFSLILSVLALFIGVGIYPLIRRKPSWLSFFDAFGLIAIVGLTTIHLIPHSVENGGIWGLLAVIVGLGIPALLHLMQHHEHHGGHDDEAEEHDAHHGGKPGRILMACVFVGFAIHTLLDGIGLSMSSIDNAEMGQMLGLGVLFHRLPVGIFLSLILVPRVGLKKTWVLLSCLAAATLLGYGLGHFALPAASLVFLNVLQGLIAGMLLHVVFHNISAEGHGESGIIRGAGALAGFGALAIVEWVAPVHAHDVSILDIWVRYLLDAAPAWCLLAVLLGVSIKISQKENALGRFFGKVAEILDPQPLPMLYGGTMHAFSASLIVVAWALFSPGTAAVMLAAILASSLLSRLVMRGVICCESCSPGHYCAQEKSFSLWSISSCTQIVVWLLAASVLPALCAPLTEGFAHLGFVARVCIASLAVVAVPAVMLPSRPLERLPNYVLALMALCLVMGDGLAFAGCSAAAAGLLVLLYEYSLRAIRTSEAGQGHWLARYVFMLAIGAALPAAMMIGAGALFSGETAFQVMRYEVHVEHHDHIHGGHHEAHEAHEGHNHEAHEAHEAHEGHDHEAHEGHDHEAHASILREPLHTWHKVIPFAMFMLVFGYWIFRKGPRYMLEVSRGRHHHQHD